MGPQVGGSCRSDDSQVNITPKCSLGCCVCTFSTVGIDLWLVGLRFERALILDNGIDDSRQVGSGAFACFAYEEDILDQQEHGLHRRQRTFAS